MIHLLIIVLCTQEPLPADLERLRAPQLTTRNAERMLVVEAKGDPRQVGAAAFGLLFQLYYQMPATPKGASQPAPRARWPVALERPRSEWVGLYALPVPETVESLPAHTAPPGLSARLATWEYGPVVEALQVGPYDREAPTIERMREFARERGYALLDAHEEEYIRGPTMAGPGDPERYLTILRYRVASQAFAIRGARVFDGERVWPDATVLVRDGRIAAIGPDVQVPEGAEVIEGAGHALLPGLIDAHTHTFAPGALHAALAFGVTTQLDHFAPPQMLAGWQAEQERGDAADRADIFSAGILATAPGGHGTQYGMPIPTLTAPSDAPAFVEERLAEGSDWIKIVYDDGHAFGLDLPTVDEPTLRAVIEAAHSRDALAVVHVSTLAAARDVVEAGADGLVHVWADSVPDDAFVRRMAERGTFVIATLTVQESVTGTASGAPLLEDPRLAPYLGPDERGSLTRSFPGRDGATVSYDAAKRSVAMLAAAGVPILAGSDAPNPGTIYGASLHRELELLVEAGLTPIAALTAATLAPARAFGLDDRGRIAAGLRADLVLVEGDPTADIGAARAITAVWKGGQRFDRDAYRAEVAQRLAADTMRLAAPAPLAGAAATISDFDAGDLEASFGAGWIDTTDGIMGGKSTAELAVVEGGAAGTSHALRVSGEIAAGLAFAWGGAMYFPGDQPMTPVDLSAAAGFRFQARGDGATYRVLLFTRSGGQMPATRTFATGPEWGEVSMSWSEFGSDGSDVSGIAIVGGPASGAYELWIDQVELSEAVRGSDQ